MDNIADMKQKTASPDAYYSKVHPGPLTPKERSLGLEIHAACKRHIVNPPVTFGFSRGFVLRYCLNGHARFRFGQRDVLIRAGDVHLEWPGESTLTEVDSASGFEYIWLHFSGTLAVHLVKSTGFSPESPLIALGQDNSIPDIFEELFETLRRKDFLHHHDSAHLLIDLLFHMRRLRYVSLSLAESRFDHISWQAESLDEVVKASGLSKSRFIHLFKDLTGASPWKYILSLKVERAKELLAEEHLSVRDIAETLGFTDQLYFSRLFKKHTGLSPMAFRKDIKESTGL